MFRPRKQLFWMGVDSFLVMIVYLIGLLGLFVIS
jgi:cation:H+ antiporter